FFSSRRRHTRWPRDWSSDVCSSDLRRISNYCIEPRRRARDAVVVEKHFGKFEFPMKESALVRSFLGADQKRTKVFQLVLVELSEIGRASCRKERTPLESTYVVEDTR